ncbi:hypothetical protein [Caldinitratiruptor microaerophilus]|uniref:Uncharacterized protein n=1 Tax=Caldinitratiruptor microaerophilus TaxID=671077 RepID=A0AA35CKS4_9FIRM|nr:hypothetical protein [Caldinitratiruptor microaerophilus]BDG59337.1 hypothetical protein caldi_04270 [Caldinitratiruptor microaerophilus]
MPEDRRAGDRVAHGKSPVRDPVQRRLVEKEVEEQQNPYKTAPNRLGSVDKAVDAGSRPHELHVGELKEGTDDRFKV